MFIRKSRFKNDKISITCKYVDYLLNSEKTNIKFTTNRYLTFVNIEIKTKIKVEFPKKNFRCKKYFPYKFFRP